MARSSDKQGISSRALLIALLAAFGIGGPLFKSSQPKDHDATTTSPTAKAIVIHDRHSAEGLLEEFLDITPDQTNGANNARRGPALNQPWHNDPRGRDRIQFLIATLPDPAYPPLRYQFDRYLSAIQAALAADHYVLDRFDLPWLDESATRALDGDKAQTTGKDDIESAKRPGVMLFRSDKDSRGRKWESLLVVFVVGETPTSGVNMPALHDALAQLTRLAGWSDDSGNPAPRKIVALTRVDRQSKDTTTPGAKERELKIIGPTFSGSATSLESVLRTWRAGLNSPPQVRLLSGTATAISSWPNELGHFHSTVIPDCAALPAIADYFHKDLHEPRIAIAVEEGTSYGSSYGVPDGRCYSASADESNSKVKKSDILWLRFPLHISDLRVATSESGSSENSQELTPVGHHDLPLHLEQGAGGASDVAPSFSRRSVVSDEHVLRNLLAAIGDENIHHVGIVATDVEDAIFLVQEVRQHCPNVTPFLTSADLLYLHSHVNPDLEGTLIFSTYSLFLQTQDWSAPFAGMNQVVEFPSDYAEGVYNAVLAQMDDYKDMVDYAKPFSILSSKPGSLLFPPLWVGIVGRDGLWPIQTLPVARPGRKTHGNLGHGASTSSKENARTAGEKAGGDSVWPVALLPVTETERVDNVVTSGSERSPLNNVELSTYPSSMKAVFCLVMVLCLLPNLWILAMLRTVRRRLGRFGRLLVRIAPGSRRWTVLVGGNSRGAGRTQLLDRRLYLLSLALVLLTIYIVTVSVWTLPLRAVWALQKAKLLFGGHRSAEIPLLIFSFVAAGAVGIVTIVSVVAIGLNTWRQWPSKWRSVPWIAFVTAAASFFSVLLGITFAASMWCSGSTLQSLLYFERATAIWDGVSPLLPLLYLAIAALCLAIGQLRRLSLLEAYPLPSPFLGLTTPSFEGVERHERRIVKLLNAPAYRQLWVTLIALPVLAFAAFGLFGDDPLPVDGITFWIFFVLVAAFTYVNFLLPFVRFVSLWRELRGLLYRLYFHPTRQAYEELRSSSVPPTLAHEQKIRLFEPSGSLTAVEFCLEQVRRLIGAAPQEKYGLVWVDHLGRARRELADALGVAEKTLKRVLRNEACGAWGRALWQRWELQLRMANLSVIVVRISEAKWRAEIAGCKPARSEDGFDAEIRKTAELFVACRVVDFLRQVFPQMLNLVVFSSAGLLALLLAASSYPFPLRDTVSLFSWAVMLVVAAITVGVFIQINRDRVVSMLTGSTPGKLNWESGLVMQVFIFAVLPIMTLLGAQFPYKLQEIFNWLGGMSGNLH